jgi:hypothetical protein
MRQDSRNENLFWNRMFWFDCGVDDKNSTKQSLAKPSTIHILIPIPMLTQSDFYLHLLRVGWMNFFPLS